MTSTVHIRNTATGLALICLFWISYMMVPMGHHLMAHGQLSNHPAQHSSVVCSWMCASSNFIQSHVLSFTRNFLPAQPFIPVLLALVLLNLSASNLRSRSPPV